MERVLERELELSLLEEAVRDLAQLHARVVAALAAVAGPVDNARLAHRAELAGQVDEASRYAALAATDAEHMGALRRRACRQSARSGSAQA